MNYVLSAYLSAFAFIDDMHHDRQFSNATISL